jgi:hypothetical protein
MIPREELTPTQSAGTAPEFYTWTFPGAPVRIHLYLSVVENLGREVLRAFESVPSHSVEIGGILLGTADFTTSPIVEIKEFEPFLCEYRSDHKFILSDADRRKLEKLLAARKAERQDALAVVGYYRSHLGDGLRLSPEDLAIAQACFCDPANVFLAVKPADDRSISAGFFFWDNGRIDSEFTFLEFPFDPRLLAGARIKPTIRSGARQQADPEPDTGSSAFETVAHAPPDTEDPEYERRHLPGRRWLWYPLLALLMIALGAISYQGYLRSALRAAALAPPGSDVPALLLQVERRGADLRVSWNRNSPVLAKAQDAVLSIRDGETQQQTLHLDLDQLHNGSVLYTPANTTVQFRLEVTSADNSKLSETVLALTAASPGTAPAPAPPVAKPPASQAPKASNPPPANSATGNQKASPPPAPSRDFGEPVRVVMVDPPRQSAGGAKQNEPAVAQPKPPLAVEPPPAPRAAAGATLIPPRPIRRPQPVLSAAVANLVAGEVNVDVRVWIDETGRVEKAEPLPANRPVSSSLVGAARSAALLWRFEPARQGSQPVSSVLILRFQYRPAP